MKENESFQFIGKMPLFDQLLDDVLSLTDDDWTEYDDRKKSRGAASANTDTIPLMYDTEHRIDSGILHKNYERFNSYINEVIVATTRHIGEVELRQAMLTRLKAGAVIPKHKDEGPLTAKSHRIHVPVTTNTECIFSVGSEFKNLKPGQIWIVDNVGRLHGIQNNGITNRIHLILDVA